MTRRTRYALPALGPGLPQPQTYDPPSCGPARHVYRDGDLVLIRRPLFMVRVGYPLDVNDVAERIDAADDRNSYNFPEDFEAPVDPEADGWLKDILAGMKVMGIPTCQKRVCRRIFHEWAYCYVASKRFGGRERRIYAVERPELRDTVATVFGKKRFQTGNYFAPSGGYDGWTGEYDYDPGGLDSPHTHVILETDKGWIEQVHVEPYRR